MGLIPDMSGSVSLRELLTMDQAMRSTMTGERFSGTRAAELGLVTEVSDDPLATAQALAREIAGRSPDAVVLDQEAVPDQLDGIGAQGLPHRKRIAVQAAVRQRPPRSDQGQWREARAGVQAAVGLDVAVRSAR